MCSKLISAKTERSVGFCSRPRTKARCKTKEIDIGVDASLDSAAHKYHTIVLFKQPTLTGQICCAPKGGIPIELQVPQGIHKEHLCQVFAAGVVCHYEWCWEKQNIPCVCRTTLLPLTGPEGKVAEVLSITRDISTWVGPSTSLHSTLHEGGTPKTFAQLLLAARETEKREVAKALHDEIGTASVMLSALISLVRQSVQKGDVSRTLKDLERLQTQTQQSMQRLHAIIISLRPPSLDTDGALRGSLETLIAEMCKLGRLEYRFVCAANMSEKGIIIPQNLTEARQFYELGTSMGNEQSPYALGMLYLNGVGVSKDLGKACKLFRLAYSRGNIKAYEVTKDMCN